MEKRVIPDQVTIDFKNGGIRLYRFVKQVVDDDGTVIAEQFHRTSVMPDGDDAAQLELVNAHLEQGMKVGKLSDEDVSLMLEVVAPAKRVFEGRATKAIDVLDAQLSDAEQ